MKKNIILAIETGIGGGSLSLFDQKDEIDFWKGERKVSRAEDLLLQIQTMLNRNKLSPKDIQTIYFSDGPGSLTGLRIGAATAKGLRKSLKCECFAVSGIEAMLLETSVQGVLMIAFSSGSEKIWGQFFRLKAGRLPESESAPGNFMLSSLGSYIKTNHIGTLISDEETFERIERELPELKTIGMTHIKISSTLSKLIGLKGIRDF